MKKITALPFHSLYEVNENMYENVIIVAQRSKEIISENYLKVKRGPAGLLIIALLLINSPNFKITASLPCFT